MKNRREGGREGEGESDRDGRREGGNKRMKEGRKDVVLEGKLSSSRHDRHAILS